MKVTPVLPVALLLTLLATSPVQAQTTEKIALYADKFGTDCSITDVGVRTVYVYMIHEGTGTRTGSEFRAPKPDCWTGAVWDGDELFATVGGQIGYSQGPFLALAYSACLPLPVYLGRIAFEATGDAEACCRYPVLPSAFEPASVVAVNCSFDPPIPILAGSTVINENASCPCGPPLAVESATWGQIKSLYHN